MALDTPELWKEDPRPIGDVIKEFHNGEYFTRDFWMENRIGAMKGASVKEYNEANVVLGVLGGTKPRHCYVLGPDQVDATWNEVMTSPGTIGWNKRGAKYHYDNTLSQEENYVIWVSCGCPKYNEYGGWAHGGLPLRYVEETWKGPFDRDLLQDPSWPGAFRRHRKMRWH